MWKIILFALIVAAEAPKGSEFFEKCVRNQATKGDECQKIRNIDFAIIIDRTVYRGTQNAVDGSDAHYDRFYENFLKEFHKRTNFTYGIDRVRGAVIETGYYKRAKTVRRLNEYYISENYLKIDKQEQYGGSITYLNEALSRFARMAIDEGRSDTQKVVLVVTKGTSAVKEQTEIQNVLLRLVVEGNFILCFCAMYNSNFQPPSNGKYMESLIGDRAYTGTSVTAINVDVDPWNDKGRYVADCLCDAVDFCQFEMVTVLDCRYRNADDGETCAKKVKPNIIKEGTAENGKCPIEHWENCTQMECNQSCDNATKGWEQWGETCYCDGKKRRKRITVDSSLEFTKSCSEYGESDCIPTPQNCTDFTRPKSAPNSDSDVEMIIIIIAVSIVLIIIIVVSLGLVVYFRRRSKSKKKDTVSRKSRMSKKTVSAKGKTSRKMKTRSSASRSYSQSSRSSVPSQTSVSTAPKKLTTVKPGSNYENLKIPSDISR